MTRRTALAIVVVVGLIAGGVLVARHRSPRDVRDASLERSGALMDGVSASRLVAADRDAKNWLSYGRTYSESRFSPLNEITRDNVGRLGVAWAFEFEASHWVEATPLVADGVMFLSSPWSVVRALDAKTGRLLWTYDPQVPRSMLWKAWSAANRGVALLDDKVFVGTLDGRLVAIERGTGHVLWSTMTVDASKPYFISGAPRVAEGKVLIGNGGGDFGVRGYVSAYDAMTGTLVWRFYTVPGDPRQPFESPAMEAAAKTWSGEWWKLGGGGTVWDAITYDPALGLVIIGTGNGGPWNYRYRSPDGGDNLYLSSVVALHVATGELAWYYQEVPGDMWDYTATQQLIHADVEIEGRTRKVLFHAPKNGFFYVIDRETGKLISVEKYTDVNWARSIDLTTGRPIVDPAVRYPDRDGGVLIKPSIAGGHNWQPMSYSPVEGLVYLPASSNAIVLRSAPGWTADETPKHNVGATLPGELEVGPDVKWRDSLLAWDPTRQKEVWRVPLEESDDEWMGGTLATAGGIVFQGSGGTFSAYRSDDGRRLWNTKLDFLNFGGPISFEVDGHQYIAATGGHHGPGGVGAVVVFALDATGERQIPSHPKLIELDAGDPSTEEIQGSVAFAAQCDRCHVGFAFAPMLWTRSWSQADLESIVLHGALAEKGMPKFDHLTPSDVASIRAYLDYKRRSVRSQ